MRRPLVMGNWKMNGSLTANEALLKALSSELKEISTVDVAVCPPYIYLPQAKALCELTSIRVGAQNMSDQDSGAYTGEISGQMLRQLDLTYVLIGHSERRTLFGENDQDVARKVEKALEVGLVPVLCLGETLEERQSEQTKTVIARQVKAVLDRCAISAFSQIVIAYEPVWAIGTGETASPAQAQEVHAFIRQLLAVEDEDIAARCTIIYGGSVNAATAKSLFSMADVDGGLVGGASLKADGFAEICKAAALSC